MVDILKINSIDNSIESTVEDAKYVQDIIDSTINQYCSELDRVMENIYTDIICSDYPAINVIEKYFVELSHVLYIMCEQSEKLGVFDSISKSKAQETYNSSYLKHQHSTDGKVGAKKPTVAESQAISETAAIYDKTVNDIYNRAYKIVKNKVGAAETMVSTLSKILSHRIQESQLVSMQTGRKILNEENIF